MTSGCNDNRKVLTYSLKTNPTELEFPLAKEQTKPDFSEVIAENFGANATYVETLLARFRSDPSLVDESWRAYFEELLGNGQPAAHSTAPAAQAPKPQASTASGDGSKSAAVAAPYKAKSEPPASAGGLQPAADAIPIRGAALKIVENMEASLAVPTATSQRRIPVKLLEENRRIINRHLKDNAGGKASFTHLMAYAMLRALDEFPQMNDGFEVVDGQAMRLKRESINLGIAIDLEKKDGTRSLLVPNIKNANGMRFSEFLHAYDDVVKRAR